MRVWLLGSLWIGCGDGADTTEATGDGSSRLAWYCASTEDCDGGVCVEVMCMMPCSGPDFDAASCPDGAVCHRGMCHLVCETDDMPYEPGACPEESVPAGSGTGGYRCGGPNSDYSQHIYTCYLNPTDPGG